MPGLLARALALCLVFVAGAGTAQEFSGLARLDAGASGLRDTRNGGISVTLALSQGVPYRVFTLEAPRRLVLDFREVDWRGVTPATLDRSVAVETLRMGRFRPGWSRMVVGLSGAYLLETAEMRVDRESGGAVLRVRLAAGTPAEFAARAGAPEGVDWAPAAPAAPAPPADDSFVIVLDAGHGGIDPGADRGGVREKDLMLSFAHELKEVLLRADDVQVILTREDDRFVSLDRRVAIAHRVGGDIFLSLHADALSEGHAHGATVYTLSETASDAASAALAERHDRDDILSGVDLDGQDDVVADVLMDLARQETDPRSARLAEALRLGIRQRGLRLNTRPLRTAGFSVLRSPDIPSVLLELGFLSSAKDRENIKNPAWRAEMARAVRDAIFAWRQADAAHADLVRQ